MAIRKMSKSVAGLSEILKDNRDMQESGGRMPEKEGKKTWTSEYTGGSVLFKILPQKMKDYIINKRMEAAKLMMKLFVDRNLAMSLGMPENGNNEVKPRLNFQIFGQGRE